MVLVGKFKAKVYQTSDKKKLKKSSKTYTYGSLSIRDPKLNDCVGKEVIVSVSTED